MDELHRALARRIGEDRQRYREARTSTREYFSRQVHGARLRTSEVEAQRDAALHRAAELEKQVETLIEEKRQLVVAAEAIGYAGRAGQLRW